jgi:hypothetical protein
MFLGGKMRPLSKPDLTAICEPNTCKPYRDNFTSLHEGDVRTSYEIYLRTSTACNGDRFALLCVDDARSSQETPTDLLGLLRQ